MFRVDRLMRELRRPTQSGSDTRQPILDTWDATAYGRAYPVSNKFAGLVKPEGAKRAVTWPIYPKPFPRPPHQAP